METPESGIELIELPISSAPAAAPLRRVSLAFSPLPCLFGGSSIEVLSVTLLSEIQTMDGSSQARGEQARGAAGQ